MTTVVRKNIFEDERAGRIYRMAAQMFYEKGFDATSMNEIAEAVKLTKPGLYYHVGKKQELLFAIMSYALDHLDSEVVEPARAVSDPAERLRVIVARHAGLLTQGVSAPAILIDEVGGLSEPQRDEIVGRKRAYFDFLRGTLDELAAQGRLRPLDTTVATFSLLGMVMWISRWYDPDGRLPREDVVRDVTEIALAGMLHGTTAVPVEVARAAAAG